jgi:signal transduction histidine kinase
MEGVATEHRFCVQSKGRQIPVWCDAGRIEQVLDNLLSNAVKYGEERADIGVDLEWAQEHALVTVTNRGHGIRPDEAKHLFERFVRGEHAAGIKGVGLGLYICKGLVEAHGGRIWVESVPDETTRFRFTLPLAPSATEHPSEAAPAAPSGA